MSICPTCSKKFSTKSNLNKHLTISVRCGSSTEIFCDYCDFKTKVKSSHTRHISTCRYAYAAKKNAELQKGKDVLEEKLVEKEKELQDVVLSTNTKIKVLTERNKLLKSENLELKLQLEEKKGRIVVYRERPGTINNQYINPKLLAVNCETIPPLTIENVKKEVSSGKYTYEDYIKGEIGLVNFIATLISSDDAQRNYVCTDTARNKFHRLIETREWKEDNGANFLNKIFDQLKDPATSYYEKINKMSSIPEASDVGDFLMDKTKRMFFGIIDPKSTDRVTLFNYIRTEVRKLAAI